jgi:hypothetical protein
VGPQPKDLLGQNLLGQNPLRGREFDVFTYPAICGVRMETLLDATALRRAGCDGTTGRRDEPGAGSCR